MLQPRLRAGNMKGATTLYTLPATPLYHVCSMEYPGKVNRLVQSSLCLIMFISSNNVLAMGGHADMQSRPETACLSASAALFINFI